MGGELAGGHACCLEAQPSPRRVLTLLGATLHTVLPNPRITAQAGVTPGNVSSTT
jgi:hypothetical protein